ncbi:MAG: acetate/propionate family kinase [Candidatus Woesearchaeota archaeon]
MISPEHYFILKGGTVIKSLEELVVVLKNIDKETFEYHVNSEKNDFSNWIRYVFKLERLADNIYYYNFDERQKIIDLINKHLKEFKVLVINSGSSSVKFQIIDMSSKNVLLKGMIDAIGLENSNIKIFDNIKEQKIKNHDEAISVIIKEILSQNIIGNIEELKAIIHRVVHGGEIFKEPTIIDSEVISKIEQLSNLAPLHNPHNLEAIRACMKYFKDIPEIAVFDTSFHQTIPKEKFLYGLPITYYEKYGIRKYGFHGYSHKYVSQLMMEYYKIKRKKNPKFLICHLGNGCSITAIKNGKSINNSMGFSPTDGLIMGTRCGSLDPYIAVHLEKILGINYEDLGDILNKKSGLLGLSGYSDMRSLWQNSSNDECKLAINMFVDRIVHYIGAYVAELNGIDGIVFTGGIGENAFYIRKKIINNLTYLGIVLDTKKNNRNEFIITDKKSKIECFVINTNEEYQMASDAIKLLKKS